MRIVDEFTKTFTYLLNQPLYLLALRLTLLMLIIYGGTPSPFLGSLLRIICGIMIICPPLTASRFMWITISTILVFYNAFYWVIYTNFDYLITYWSIACTIVVFSEEPNEVMGWNARMLIGLCFLFAATWKFIGGEYLDGTVQHFVFLNDHRMENLSSIFGLGKDVLAENRGLLGMIREMPGKDVGVTLKTSTSMHIFCVITSYWTILIESAIAIVFLLTLPRWFGKVRDVLLIIFIISTYFFFPVPVFAFAITLLGFAQCSLHRRKTRITYLLLLVMLQLSTLPVMFPTLLNTFTSYFKSIWV